MPYAPGMRVAFGSLGWSVVLLSACAAAPAQPTTPRRTELVIDEASVVRAERREAPIEDQRLVPPLLQAPEMSSADFQAGYAMAWELLALPGPTPPSPTTDAAGYRAWLGSIFEPWLKVREQQLGRALWSLQRVSAGAPGEAIPALGLSGLVVERFRAHMTSVPPPPEVRSDEKLTRIYQNGLNTLVTPFLRDARSAYQRCAELAGAGGELSFGPWLARCQERQAAIDTELSVINALADKVAAEREADRLALEGPKPPGPALCWAPHIGRQGPPPVDPARPAAVAVVDSSANAAAPSSPDAKRCALSLSPNASSLPSAATPSPRDLRYGLRDAESGVRVSFDLAENPTMDASPLSNTELQSQLAHCFAKQVQKSQAITVALHAALSVDALGHVTQVELTPEPSDAATPPSKSLTRCLSQALQHVAFDCSPSAQPTQAHASYCLRRD